MAKFIEAETKMGKALVNLDNIDCIVTIKENQAVLNFSGSESAMKLAESYASFKARILD